MEGGAVCPSDLLHSNTFTQSDGESMKCLEKNLKRILKTT